MATPKVFVSSTCYDLSILRSQIRMFINSLGYDPIMSDFNDILFDPRNHTHDNCINEVSNCDLLILFIGSRFGGLAIPSANDLVNLPLVKDSSNGSEVLFDQSKFSITQLEVFKAIENNIPVYTFIDDKVFYEHHIYEKNKNKPDVMKSIEFPSIDKKETAIYIFEFINFMRLRTNNNSIYPFSKIEDIENNLKKQWAALFQILLFEMRYKKNDEKKMLSIESRLDDLRAMFFTSISDSTLKETAKGVFKYRLLVEFLSSALQKNITAIIEESIKWSKLLNKAEIVEIRVNQDRERDRVGGSTYIIFRSRKFLISRIPAERINKLEFEWEEFRKLRKDSKSAIVNAILESDTFPMRFGIVREEKFEDFIKERDVKHSLFSTISDEDNLMNNDLPFFAKKKLKK